MRNKIEPRRRGSRILPYEALRERCPRCGGMKDGWDLRVYRKRGRWKVTPGKARYSRRVRRAGMPTVRIRRQQPKCQHPFHRKVDYSV